MKQGFWTRSRDTVALLVMITLAVVVPARVYANPEGGVVTAGQATITVRPNIVDVHQQSDKAVIDWRSFDIDNGETTEFHQPNAAAIALNRVHSSQASVINGALKANGNVIVVNQNGVLFGRNAKVDVNGLLATTADIDNDKFMNQSKLTFDKPGNPTASIVNQGQITAKESGLVGFVAPNVQNDGIIAARLGRVHLAAGDKATVDFYGDGLMEVAVSDEVRHQLVQNSGTISADGGTVALTAAAGSRIIASSLEVGGTVSAQTVGMQNGRIVIAGLGGNAVAGNVASRKTGTTISTVRVAGHLNASGTGSGQKGGSITVTGDKVHLASSAKLNASGHSGGGSIKVGGDFYGAGKTPTANLLLVDRGASLLNDAIYIGNGGTTALWSDGGTNFAGSISNRGGQFGGNGGFVEVSGKQALGYHGTVDTRAPLGRVGTLLLDPADITISNAANSNISGSTPFGSTGAATSNLNVGTLVSALGTSNVTITTAAGTGGFGDVTFVDAVNWNSTFGLTVTADRHINVNAAITNSGTGGVTLNANTAGSNITIAAPISTGGNITLSAAQDLLINAGLTAGGTMNLTAASRDILANASGLLSATGALTTTSGRHTTFGANVTSGGNINSTAAQNLTVNAGATVTNGAASTMSLRAAGGSTAGTGNLALNGNLNVGTGAFTLVSGINGTRPSWTATTTNLLRQGATFGVTNISGFLNLAINRDLNSSSTVTLTGNNTGGTIAVGSGSTVSGTTVTTNSALDTTINGAINSTGGVSITSAQDVLIGAAGSVTSSGNMTFTVTRDTTMASGAVLNVGGILNVSGRDATFGTINGSNQLNALVSRNITTLAGTTQTSGAANGISFQAAGGSPTGTGNLNLNGNLSVGTGTLTLVSGINGTRPNWTATATNLVRQGATFGNVSITGFLNLVIDRSLNSSGTVSLAASQTGGNITVNNGATVSGTALTFNSNLATTINGAVNSSGTLGYTSGQDLVIGATGTSNSTGNTTVTVTRDVLIDGAVSSTGSFGGSITRDLIMGTGGSLNAGSALTLAARDITLGNVTVAGDITATATRDLSTLTGTTITPASSGSLTLQAAGGVVTGTGNLNLNGTLNAGTGNLTLVSGANGTRPNWTLTNANLTMQGATLGVVNISGFLDTFINRNINSSSNITITSFRDLTIGGGYTITPSGAGQINLRAANNVVGGTGALYINGTLNPGTGTVNLLSGDNGGRPNWTITSSNLTMQSPTFGVLNMTGFGNLTVDRDITSNNNITLNAYGDLTVNGGRTITSGAAFGVTLTAANNVVTGAGNLILNGLVRSGSAGLTLTSGDNGGTRPSLTLDGTRLQRIGASYGTMTINGFLDVFINENIISGGNIFISAFRDLTLNVANTVTTGTAGSLTLRAANGSVAGAGSLYLNGTMSVGNAGLTLVTGVTGGVRQDFTFDATKVVPNNTNYGAISLTGFQNVTFDRNVTSNSNITVTAIGDINVNSGYAVRTGTAGTLTLQAANNSTGGTGNLNLNGVIGVGTGGAVLSSGINGTRPSWTGDSTNFLRLGAHMGLINIQGFQDLVIDRDINAGSNLTLLAMRNLTINPGYTVGSASGSLTSIRAAGGVVANTGQLLILGSIASGTSGLTLLSGHDGSGVRPTFLANSTSLVRQGVSFGAINIQGFGNFIVDREMNTVGASNISFSNNTRLTLRDNIVATGTGTITITNPIVVDEGYNPTISTNNRAIQLNAIEDTVGGVAETLTVDAGTANISFGSTINGIGLTANGGTITFPAAIGNVRPLQDVSITATNTLALPSITANQIYARTTGAAANISIAAGRSLTASAAGDAIILAAGQNFLNNSGLGMGTMNMPGGGRYIIYSTNPSSDTQGGLTYDHRRFSCAIATPGTCAYSPVINATISVPGTGNVFLYSATPILLAVIPQSIANIIYGSAAPNLTNYAYQAFTMASGYLTASDLANDVVTGTINGQTNYTQGSGVGNYNISWLSGDLSSSLGYGFDYQTLNNAFSVTPRHVTVDLTGIASKVYNGNTTATLASGNYLINNIYSGDVLTLGVSNSGAAYDTKNVGTSKTVTANGLALTGAVAANYVLDNSSAVANIGTITQRALTISATGTNRVYDATTGTTVTLGDNRVGGDVLVLGYGSAAFVNKNVGTGKTVNVSGITLGGTDAGNYSFNTTATTTANITARALTISATGVNKVYNGNTTATVTLGDNRIGGDVLTLGYGSALFGNKNVGTGKTVNVSGITLTGTDAGNYSFNTTAATTADITARALTISATGVNRIYDATTGATVTLGDNRVGGDVLTLGYGSAAFGDKNVANGKTVNVSGITLGGTDAGNYTFNTTATTTANITPRALTISATGVNKVYDGNTTASVTLGDNRLGGDVLTLGYGSALFVNKNAGTGKTVNVSGITLGGTDAGNYSFNTTAATTANITARALTISATGVNKVYNGNTTATVTLGDNRVGGDVLTLGYGSALFGDKNVANGKTVNVSGITLTGTDAGNYTFNTTASTTANITARALTISATGVNRVYDATTGATVTLGDDRVGGDVLTLGYGSAAFGNKNAGTGKTVNVSGITLGGTDAANYTFNTTTTTTANITPRALVISATGVNRVYDATTGATVTLGDDRIGGDVLVLGYGSALFGNKNVANGKTVNVSGITLGGADAGNYSFNTTATTTANITPYALTISANGINKIYDGNTVATVNLSDNRFGGDVLTTNYASAAYGDKNVANGKAVNVSGITLTGTDAGNYTFNTTASTTSNITPRALTISATGVNRVYDATTGATVTLGDNRVGGDVLVLGYGSAAFGDKNVANGKTVNVSGITLGGTDAGNYSFNTTATTTANITPRALVISATGIDKIYNGNTVGTVTLGDDRIGGDVLVLGYGSAAYGDKNVANGKTVNVSGITLGGADAGNYSFNTTASTTANITPRALVIGATGINRVYDATTGATVTLGDNRVGGDVLVLGYGSAAFGDKNVANGKTVNVSGITLGGTDAGNYTFNTTATTTANITPYALTISAAGVNRVYDATTGATVTLGDNRFGGDVLVLGYGSAAYGDKNVANGKTVNVSGISLGGADAGNYSFNTTATTTANITPYALTISASGINKIYDGNTVATVNLGDNRFGGDVLVLGYGSAAYGDKNVANGKTVNVLGITLGGADAGNYTFNTTAVTAADITPRALTIGATGVNRVYDATTGATVTLGDNRVGGDVLVLGYGSAAFGDKNVANGKTVNVSGITLGGTDAGNYTFNTTATTTANITPYTLTISANGINKVYNGNTVATVSLSDDRFGGDVLSTNYGSAAYGDKNVANGKTVNVSGITLGGADAGNYTFNTTAVTAADITPRALVVSATGINRVYDATTGATVTLGDDRIGGDVLVLGYGTAEFGNKNVGTGKTVTVNGITIGGADAGNYTFNTSTTTTANITPLALTVTANGIDRVYNGTTGATVTLGDNRLGGDNLIVTYGSALFGDKNVANGKTVNVSGISLAGADAGNYSFNTTASTTANITPYALTISASGTNRVYNGTTGAIVTLGDDRIGGDVLVLGYGSAAFGDKNVGNSKTVNVSGITLGGADAGNYTFNTSTTTTANITPYALIVSATGSSKVYDGTNVASVTLGDNRIGGDVLAIGYGTALFPDKNAGNGRTVTVSGITVGGTDAGNYTFNTTATTTADITKATLTVTAANQNIIYGTVVPGTTLGYSGFVGSEGVGDLGTAPVASSAQSGIVNAGTYTNNYMVGGGVDGNYNFVYMPGTLTVGKKTLTVTANGQTVTYGTAVPGGTLTYSGFITGQDESFLITQPTVNSANSGIVNAGTYTNNYTVGGGVSNNYDFSYFNGNLVVTKKDLNVTANNISITYGASVPAGSLIYSGFIGSEGVGDLDVAPTLSSANSGIVNAGTYTNNYTVSGGSDGNYTFHYAPGTLTVTPAGLNVTVNNQSITYGTVVPGTTITYSGFVNGDTELNLDVAPTISSLYNGIVGADTYTGNYTASGGVSSNYTFNYVAGNLVVSKKALNVTAGNRTVTYGTAVPGSSLSYSGFISGEGVGDLISAPTIVSGQSGIVNAGTYAGNYAIVGGASDNYYFNFTAGDLVVNQRTLTVSATPQSIVYGTAVPVGSISYNGFISGEGVGDLDVVPTLSSANSGIVNAGTYTNNYTVSGGASGNYAFVYAPADLVVSKATLSVTANGRTITYGTAVPGTTLTYSGFITGQNATFLDVAPTVSSTNSGFVNAGTYVGNYVASGGVDTNYDFVYTAGTLQVNQAALTISASNVNHVYGSGNTFNGYGVSGLQLGETIGGVVLSTNASSSAGGQWNAGTWNVVAGGANGGTFNPANYIINYINGTMVITPRVLTVTPTAADRVYDGTDHASVVLGNNGIAGDAITLSYTNAHFADKHAGANRVVTVNGITLAGADAGNYTVTATATTTATINQRVLTVVASALNKQHDGTTLATVTLNDNRLGGDVLTVGYGSANFADANVGANKLVTINGITLLGADAGNYSVAPVATTTASILSNAPPIPTIEPPPTVIKVSQDTGSVFVTTSDDGIYATPSTSYQLIYLPYDAPDENRWRNKPLRAGVGGVPIIEPTAWYGWLELQAEHGDDGSAAAAVSI